MNGMHALWAVTFATLGFVAGVLGSCNRGPAAPWAVADSTHVYVWQDSTAECRIATNPALGIALSCWPRRRLR